MSAADKKKKSGKSGAKERGPEENGSGPEIEAASEEGAASKTPAPPAPPTPEEQIADLKDKLLRALAENENVRRRAERQQSEASQYAITGFARDVLSIADNLHRALEAIPEGLRDNGEGETFVSGIEMTERELLNALERHGIRKILPEGEKFDHNLHQAVFEVEDTGAPAGTVVQVVQPGYVIKDRLLRPAMVGVAKARPGKSGGVDETV